MSPDDSGPEFDSMSPEEMIQWMNSVDKRHGEKFATDDDLGEEAMDPMNSEQPLANNPPPSDDLEWLKSLARAQQGNELVDFAAPDANPNLLTTIAEEDSEIVEDAEMISWLQELAEEQEKRADSTDSNRIEDSIADKKDDKQLADDDDQEDATGTVGNLNDPIAGGADPLEWLETLAKRQGSADEELITEADFDIPLPDHVENNGPGYREHSFQSPSFSTNPLHFSLPSRKSDSKEAPKDHNENIEVETPDEREAPEEGSAEKSPAVESLSGELDDQENETGEIQTPTDWLEELARGYYAENFSEVEEAEEEFDDHDELLADKRDWRAKTESAQNRLTYPREWLADMPDNDENDHNRIDQTTTLNNNEEDNQKIIPFDERTTYTEQQTDKHKGVKDDYTPEEKDMTADTFANHDEPLPDDSSEETEDDSQKMRSSWLDSLVAGRKRMETPDTNDTIYAAPPDDNWQPLPFDLLPEDEELTVEDSAEDSAEEEEDPRIFSDQFVMSAPVQPSAIPDWLRDEDKTDSTQNANDIFVDDIEDEIYEEQTPTPVSRTSMVLHWLTDGNISLTRTPKSQPSSASRISSPEPEQPLPDWLNTDDSPSASSQTGEDQPYNPILEWLRQVQPIEQSDTEIPAWILEHKPKTEPDTIVMKSSQTELSPAQKGPSTLSVSPIIERPKHPVPMNLDTRETLRNARNQIRIGQIDKSLFEYEKLIRANMEIANVVHDLTRIAHGPGQQTNPAVYRVLGDGLMREGRLQEALNTYKQALNLL